jgi:hypothetical protein
MSEWMRLTNLRVAQQPEDGPSLVLRPEEVTDFRAATLVVTKDGRWHFVNEQPCQVLVQMGAEINSGLVYLRDDFIDDYEVCGWSRGAKVREPDPLDAIVDGEPLDDTEGNRA